LNQCKGKGEERVNEHIKVLQEVYQEIYQDTLQSIAVDKGKEKEKIVQDKKVFLYKLYTISLEPSRLTILEPILLKEEIDNLEQALKNIKISNKDYTIPLSSSL